jgi:mono/diheme cytochrome c family protein
MKLKWTAFFVAAGIFLIGAKAPAAGPAPATNSIVTTTPVYVPNTAHANDPLPDDILSWDAVSKSTDATGNVTVHFIFNFTNIAKKIELGHAATVTSFTNFTTITNSSFWARLWGKKFTQVTNVINTTNWVTVTNSITPIPVTILSVRPSCGCTTAEMPPLPWTLAPGTNGQIRLSVNIEGRSGTQFKTVVVSTDQGSKTLMLRINILPPVIPKMTEEERARDLAAAKIDRQAVFQGDCAKCHLNNIQGKYGKPLFDSICAICHEAEQRAAVVPDLYKFKTPTNTEFWRTWIAHGKPGSLMPAFASSDGGPLTDMQIASIAAFLNVAIPSQVPINK